MEGLLGSSIDEKNIELAKTLFCLRQDMDVYCLIGVNASKIQANAIGTLFFGHLQKRMIECIVLAICKLYEDEKRNELNSNRQYDAFDHPFLKVAKKQGPNGIGLY